MNSKPLIINKKTECKKSTPSIDKNSLKRLYVDDGMSRQDVADFFGVNVWQISEALRKFGIKKRHYEKTADLNLNKGGLGFNSPVHDSRTVNVAQLVQNFT